MVWSDIAGLELYILVAFRLRYCSLSGTGARTSLEDLFLLLDSVTAAYKIYVYSRGVMSRIDLCGNYKWSKYGCFDVDVDALVIARSFLYGVLYGFVLAPHTPSVETLLGKITALHLLLLK